MACGQRILLPVQKHKESHINLLEHIRRSNTNIISINITSCRMKRKYVTQQLTDKTMTIHSGSSEVKSSFKLSYLDFWHVAHEPSLVLE